MIRNNGDLGRLSLLLGAALTALVWGVPRPAQAGTWPENTRPQTFFGAPSPAAQSTYFSLGGYRVGAADFPIHMVHLGAVPAGMTQAQVDAAARGAADTWSRTPCAFARMDYAGQRETLAELAPGEVPFQFVEPGGAGCLPAGSIGWTALSCGPDFPINSIFLNQQDYQWSDEARPFEQVGGGGSLGLSVELQSVLTHEFGHVLGLLHSEDLRAAMAPNYRADGGQKYLSIDDKLGLCALYPALNPAPECRSGRDCPAHQNCARVQLQTLDGAEAGGRIALCHEPRGALGEACAPDRLICAQGCVFSAEPQEFGYCTVECDAGDCPSDYECQEGLIRPDEAHCRQVRAPESPACNIAPGSLPGPFAIGLAALASVFWVGRRRVSRPLKTR